MANSTTSTSGKRNLSLEERIAFLDAPEGWDYLFGGAGAPAITLSFEGDSLAWQKLKARAAAEGMNPPTLIRFLLDDYLEGSKRAFARQRLAIHEAWERTRPVQVVDRKGVRWVPLDLLGEELRRDDKAG